MLETIRLTLSLLPAIIRAVKEIEEVFPESGMGSVKLRLIREVLESTVDGISTIWPTIQRIIALVVKVFNESEVFSHDGAKKP